MQPTFSNTPQNKTGAVMASALIFFGNRLQPIAARMLARYTMRGLGGPRDIEAGHRWYAQAASLGVPEAANELASLDQALDRVAGARFPRWSGNKLRPRNRMMIMVARGDTSRNSATHGPARSSRSRTGNRPGAFNSAQLCLQRSR